MPNRPNVLFVFADQWRAQATGYAGDANVHTPNLDALAAESVNFTHAVSGCPVCSPYRASLLTGQNPLTHGIFVNDVPLAPDAGRLARRFAAAGYDTAYIGKWHLDAHGRSAWIPPERRQGFRYWKVLECTHDYPHSAYYAGDSAEKRYWPGYDAFAQTRDAIAYLRERPNDRPFLLMLSWGPPHSPYYTAPDEFRARYSPEALRLPPNVPPETAARARQILAGYYAHCTALDAALGELLAALRALGLEEDTLLVFTSDHGDMLGSQGHFNKQRPWDESVRVPFLLRHPARLGRAPRRLNAPLDAPDLLPTLLGLCGLPIPAGVEGLDFSAHILGGPDPSDGAALLACYHPFGQYNRPKHGGREYRGLRTERHTYVRALDGPWLLYDNTTDPFQMHNLAAAPEHAALRRDLDDRLRERLRTLGDEFRPGMEYIRRWNYVVDDDGTVPYTD